jgi:hypothetical protein
MDRVDIKEAKQWIVSQTGKGAKPIKKLQDREPGIMLQVILQHMLAQIVGKVTQLF